MKTKTGEIRVWTYAENYPIQMGAEAPFDIDERLVLDAWFDYHGHPGTSELDPETVRWLIDQMNHMVLYSVLKSDDIDPDTCGGYHSEASGKRSQSAWFINAELIEKIVYDPAPPLSRKDTD